MDRFDLNSLLSLWDCMWARLSPVWRFFTWMLYPLLRLGTRPLALLWGKDGRRRTGSEASDKNQVPSFLEEEVALVREGQQEAGAGTGAANLESEPFCEPQRFEEEEEEEEKEEGEEEFDDKEYRVETTDELYCGYDSTWEIEQDQKSSFRGNRRPAASRCFKFSRFERAARDMQNYRHNYPYQSGVNGWKNDHKPNLSFYLGVTCSLPDGLYINNFHDDWSGDYDTLEHVHTYIQWLFPLQEPGMNSEATPMTREEVEDFLESSEAKENLLKSYKLMLDFYGIELCDEKTGEVRRASNWRERFNNLDSHTHNNLRITRILKCLGTLGYRHYQAPLVRFFLVETLVHRQLSRVKDSVLNYFVFAVLDKRQRRSLIKFAFLNYDSRDEFVWCPKKIQTLWSEPPRRVNDKIRCCGLSESPQ